MTKLDHLLILERALAASIARLETRREYKAPKGLKLLKPHRDRVQGQIVRDIAWPRYLVWRAYLLSRKPKPASLLAAAHKGRGMIFAFYASWTQQHGKPLPTDHPIPDFAKPTQRMMQATEQRADPPLNPTPNDPNWWPTPPDEVVAWWDEFGWESGLPPIDLSQVSPEQRKQWDDQIMAEVAASLAFDDWLQNVVLSDLQVLQLLETYWNGQGGVLAAEEMFGTTGIAGAFDLQDPAMMDFLRYQSGAMVKGIDAKTHEQLSEALWSGLGGEVEQGIGPYGIPQLASYVQDLMNQWENNLAGMSARRAMMIANTETARAETFGQFVNMLSTGVQYKQWMITTGACIICEGNASMGAVPIRNAYPSGHYSPPSHPNCLPEGTGVDCLEPRTVYRRHYIGEMVTITTHTNEVLRATPNHPIWTHRGWVPIGEVFAGDKVGMVEKDSSELLLIEEVVESILHADDTDATHTHFDAPALHGDAHPGESADIGWYRHDRPTLIGNPTPDRFVPIRHVRRDPFDGLVYNLETETGFFAANLFITQNCRCSIAPWVDETQFNPKDWEFAPDPTQLENLFRDPSFANWPNQVVDLNLPGLGMAPPPVAESMFNFGKLTYDALPPALQQIIDKAAFNDIDIKALDIYKSMVQGFGQRVTDAVNASSPIPSDEADNWTGTLDDILKASTETPADLQSFGQTLSNLFNDALSQLGDDLSNLDDTGSE